MIYLDMININMIKISEFDKDYVGDKVNGRNVSF